MGGCGACHFASQLPPGVSGSHPPRLEGLRDQPGAGTEWAPESARTRFPGRAPGGRRFVPGPIPRLVLLRKCGEKARNQACQAPRPLRARPPPRPRLQEAGWRERPAGRWERPRRLPRPAARSCHCGRRRPPPPPAPVQRLPGRIARSCCSRTRTRAAGAERLGSRTEPTPLGWAGEGALPDPLFREVRCWTPGFVGEWSKVMAGKPQGPDPTHCLFWL